jgi:hypothetical protein
LISREGLSAETPVTAVTEPSAPTLQTDESTFKQIFENNVSAAIQDSGANESTFDAEAQVSYATLDQVSLSNKYFDVPLSDGMSAIPMFQMNFSYHVFSWRGLRIDPVVSVGYGFREALVNVRSKQGLSLRDNIQVHMIPLSGSARISYQLPFASFIKIEARPGIGVQWLYQAGALDGIDQGFWIPMGYVSAGLNLFDQSQKSNSWFGGVSVTGTRAINLTSDQTSKLWQLDLGVRFLL